MKMYLRPDLGIVNICQYIHVSRKTGSHLIDFQWTINVHFSFVLNRVVAFVFFVSGQNGAT